MALIVRKSGRGDWRTTIPNIAGIVVRRVLAFKPIRFTWAELLDLSAYRRPPKKPRARENAKVFAIRRKGYRTVGQIAAAAGIPLTTFRRWEGKRSPEVPVVDGMKAVTEEEFKEVVERCRRLRWEVLRAGGYKGAGIRFSPPRGRPATLARQAQHASLVLTLTAARGILRMKRSTGAL
jgi:AcrR family transcriptional regulator